jgi:precorrin-6A/cobalt-precorrin-6A reductase
MRLLILGGTTEASALARRIAGMPGLDPMLSFAGRTRSPAVPPIPFRIGGFGGIAGLKTYLVEAKVDAVINATHPFAAQMSRNAAAACRDLALPLVRLIRPAWSKQEGDRWTGVPTMEAAVRALGESVRRVFLTIGGLQLAVFAAAPQHHYVIRTIDPPDAIGSLPSHRLILARGPFSVTDEISLMSEEGIQVLVSKNSGGGAVGGKIAAARTLGVEVIMVERPPTVDVPSSGSIDVILAWIENHCTAP